MHEPTRTADPAAARRARTIYRAALVAAGLTALGVTFVLAVAASSWIGRPFPGFFVLPNRVIPSVGLTSWAGSEDGVVYQRTVIAVDGARVSESGDVYRHAQSLAPGTAIAYTLRHGTAVETLKLDSRTFSRLDYWAIFGSYVLTGLLYVGLGLVATWLLKETPLGRALLYLGGVAGIYALSGATLYAPGADMRLHVLAESFFPAALVYLGCVFPRERGRFVTPVVATAWWLSLALAIPYQLLLHQPAAYSALHAACEAYLGLAGLGFGVVLIVERARAGQAASPLLRAAVAGALLGLGVPAVVMTISGLSGGTIPVNVCTATAFLFPLCLGYGLVRERFGREARVTVAAI
jgi:hypothetical protein